MRSKKLKKRTKKLWHLKGATAFLLSEMVIPPPESFAAQIGVLCILIAKCFSWIFYRLFFGRIHVSESVLVKSHSRVELQQRHGALGGLQHGDVVAVRPEAGRHFIRDANDACAAHNQNADAIFFNGFLHAR